MKHAAVLLLLALAACSDPEPLTPDQEEWNVATCEGLCNLVRCERDWPSHTTSSPLWECHERCDGAEIIQSCTEDEQALLAFCADVGREHLAQGSCSIAIGDTAAVACPMTNPPLCDYEPADCEPGVIPDCWSP